jgi:uncharacterized protein YjbJ (UPF0337 family)
MAGVDDVLKGQWGQLRGQIRQWWGELTDDDVDMIAGSRKRLAGRLQEVYGWTVEQVNGEIDRFFGIRPLPT